MKVLIVDDNAINRKLLCVTLEAEGLTTIGASDGFEALKTLKREKFDAIISDVYMPVMDGYRLCNEIRKSKQYCNLPFIFYTNTYMSMEDETLAMNLGGTMFLKKPSSTKMVLEALQQIKKGSYDLQADKTASLDEFQTLKDYSERLNKKLDEKAIEFNDRIRGLNCLLQIASLTELKDEPLDIIFRKIVDVIPAAFKYPEICECRIVLFDMELKTKNFKQTDWKLSREIIAGKIPVGKVEIVYLEKRAENFSDPFLSEEEDLISAISSRLSEIIERKQAEEELKQTVKTLERSNKELEQFAYVLAHDLQEPIRMVSNFTKLLNMKYKDKIDSVADEYIGFIIEGANRMHTLINDLLQYSRITSQADEFKPTDCNKVISGVLNDLSLNVEDYNVEIIRNHLPVINSVPAQMGQLFQNLIQNAIKFHSERKPEVIISAELQKNEWLFSIKDNGIGIESQYYERIFLTFQRLNEREKYSGNGIGLSICKKIVERHGGRIWVESTPDQGSTFYFTIPQITK